VRCERERGAIVRLTVSGHAGFADHGSDIVCAAASALVQSAAHGVVTFCGSARASTHDNPDGDYVLEVPRGGNARAQAVLESTVSGLRAIARRHPSHLAVHSAGK
jgi:uncharacterized protein YsxB (DUF464 family)